MIVIMHELVYVKHYSNSFQYIDLIILCNGSVKLALLYADLFLQK